MSEIIKFIFEDAWVGSLLTIAFSLLFADIKLYHSIYSRWNRCCLYLAEACLILFLLYWKLRGINRYAENLLWLAILLSASDFVLFIIPQVRLYIFNRKWMEEPDALARWRLLDKTPVGLTQWEAYNREWRKVSTLIFLACFSKAEVKVGELEKYAQKWNNNSRKYKEHQTRVNYYHGMKAMSRNDNDSALSYFKAMEKHSGSTDFENLFSSNVNIGVCYARRGDYHLACDSFRAALVLLDKHELEHGNKDTIVRRQNLFVLYSDYAICLYQTKPERVDQLLDDYRSRIEDTAEELINWFNIHMTIMRQQQLAHSKQEFEIQEFYKATYPLLKDSKERCIFISSMARIACDARLNPKSMLDDLHKELKSLDDLLMPDKFVVFSNLDYMFSRLGGRFYDKTYRKERTAVHEYMSGQAADDLNKYLHSLPTEAVYQQIQCYQNLASVYSANQMVVNDIQHAVVDAVLQGKSPMDAVQEALDKQKEQSGTNQKKKKSHRKKQDREYHREYDIKKPIGYLEEAAKKADDEGLVDLAFHIRLNIVDEMTVLINMNEDGWPKYPEEMHTRIDAIEHDYLPQIQDDKMAIAEFAIRLSYFHLLLGEYDECLDDYYKYSEEAVSTARFAPWLREQDLRIRWCVRTICFYNAIKEAQTAPELNTLDQSAQNLIKNSLCSTGELTSKWIGRFLHLGNFTMISRGWLEADKTMPQILTGPYQHSWILSTPFMMSVDLTYGQFKDDKYCDRILFPTGYVISDGRKIAVGHPMDMGRSNFLQKIMNNGGQVQKVPSLTEMTYSPETIDPNSAEEKAYQFILTKVDKRCPSIEDIKREDLRLAEGTMVK